MTRRRLGRALQLLSSCCSAGTVIAGYGLLLVLANAAAAAELDSRYGQISATPMPGATAYLVSLDGRGLLTVPAQQVSLHRLLPRGKDEFLIVETWQPGLHCHSEFVLLTIHPDQSFAASPRFGACHDLKSAAALRQGVRIVLSSTVDPTRVETFFWIDGKLSRL
jgi:hypothetical protein